MSVWNNGNVDSFPLESYSHTLVMPEKRIHSNLWFLFPARLFENRTTNHCIRRHTPPPELGCCVASGCIAHAARHPPLYARARQPPYPTLLRLHCAGGHALPPQALHTRDAPPEKRRERNVQQSTEWMRLVLYFYLHPTCMNKVQWPHIRLLTKCATNVLSVSLSTNNNL